MKNWILLTIAAFLFFSGCLKEETILPMDNFLIKESVKYNAGIGEEIMLYYNETVLIRPDGFTVSFTDVKEDSRCPTGVNCIWEGRAVIKLVIENRKESYEALLETPNSQQVNGQAINLFGRTIKLIDVAPYPEAEKPFTSNKYRVIIVVDELEDLFDGK